MLDETDSGTAANASLLGAKTVLFPWPSWLKRAIPSVVLARVSAMPARAVKLLALESASFLVDEREDSRQCTDNGGEVGGISHTRLRRHGARSGTGAGRGFSSGRDGLGSRSDSGGSTALRKSDREEG